MANGAAGKWHSYWKAGPDGPLDPDPIDWDAIDWDAEEIIEVPGVSEIRATSSSFPRATTGGACDTFHPRHFAQLSDPLLVVMAKMFKLILQLWHFPRLVASLLVVLIPKPAGGDRPIGLFAAFFRVWTKWMHFRYVKPWSAGLPRKYWFGEKDRACETCVWIQAATAEYAAYKDGLSYACGLLDLEKAYENIKHRNLVREARRHRFPMRLIRLAIMLYRMPRMVVIEGIATVYVYTHQTVVAGCSFAVDLMKLSVVTAVDNVQEANPKAWLAVVVDDLTAAAVGRPSEVFQIVKNVIASLRAELSNCEVSAVLSEAKSQLMASSAKLVKRLGATVECAALTAVSQTKNLGSDFTAGGPASYKVRNKRLASLGPRVRRMRVLRRAGARSSRLVATGLTPAGLYANSVTGLPPSQLLKMRRLARQGGSLRSAGRNLTLDLLMVGPKHDPAYKANRDPIIAWHKALWDQRIPRPWQAVAFSYAIKLPRKRTWSHVRGPSGAVVATLRRIGWEPRSVNRWVTHRGPINLLEVCPASLSKLVDEATTAWLFRDLALSTPGLDFLANGCCVEALHGLLKPKGEDWTPKHVGVMRALVANGIWTQDRLCRAGLVPEPWCLHCGARGTLFHRCFECPVSAAYRHQYFEDDSQEGNLLDGALRNCHEPWAPYFVRGLFPTALVPADVPPPCNEAEASEQVETTWYVNSPLGYVIGKVCTDGSGLHVKTPLLTRCGWGFCQIAPVGQGWVEAAFRGPLPGFIQEVPRAELYAVYQVLLNGTPPLEIFTDCKFVADGYKAGHRATCTSGYAHADLWALVWDRIDDLGGCDQVSIKWTKGHASRVDVERATVSAWQRTGNHRADRLARDGAACHPSVDAVAARHQEVVFLNQLYLKFCTRICMRVERLTPDASPNRTLGNSLRPRVPRVLEKKAFAHAFQPSPSGRGWTCWVCAKSSVLKANLARQRCAANVHLASHSLWKVGRFTFCSRCGARHSERVRLLRRPCTGSPSSASTARCLRLMKDGRDPAVAGAPFVGRPVPDLSLLAMLRKGKSSASSSSLPPPLQPVGFDPAIDELIFSALPVVNVVHEHGDDGEAACVWENCR